MEQKNRWYGKGIKTAVKIVNKIEEGTPEVRQKILILDIFGVKGIEYIKDMFLVGRSTIYLWKKKLKEEGIIGLRNKSRAPIHTRKSTVGEEIKEFVKKYRIEHKRAGKSVVYAQLKQYCKREGKKSVSESTVGRVIKELKNKGEIDNQKELRINGKTGKIREIKKKRIKKNRLKKTEIKNIGEVVQIDSIHLRYADRKLYVITSIDRRSRYVYAKAYTNLNSLLTTDFMNEMMTKIPFNIEAIQTDNGLEFGKYFNQYITNNNIIHYFNYPQSPKSNAYIERFNRTIQEQFFDYLENIDNINEINKKLNEYLYWYNFEKVHKGLNYITPMDFINANLIN